MLYNLPAPAKINLFLHVVGKRGNYHLLQSVFKLIDLNDYISFDLSTSGSITREKKLANVSLANDLTLRAAHLLRKLTGIKYGVYINVEKNIPYESGLGGGSSDAATTLIALNRLWSTNLTQIDLMKIGSKLGADIPFFIFGQSAFANGIGDILERVQLSRKIYLLFKTNINISTKEIFNCYNLEYKCLINKNDFMNYNENNYFGMNDLEKIVYIKYPSILKICDRITKIGIEVRMTGSGSCFFAEFSSFSDAILAKEKIRDIMNDVAKCDINLDSKKFFIYICSDLDKHPLLDWIN